MNALITTTAAQQMLAEARSVLDVKDVRDKAEALRTYARMAKDRDAELSAAEIRVRAERRLGEMLLDIKRAGGLDRTANLRSSPGELRESLDDLGVDKKLSMRAQQLAQVPMAEFERRLATWREEEQARAARSVSSLFKAAARPAAPAHAPELPDGRYRVIYADPPWRFETWSDAGNNRSADNHYPTMPVDAICALPIGDIAADDCVLFLWAVGPMLDAAFRVIEAWGFTYKTIGFTWAKTDAGDEDKDWQGMGYWTRANAEVCLLATRGKIARREGATDVAQLIRAPRTRHSEKPAEAASRIQRLVEGPYIELFARTDRDGWDSWGHQVGEAAPAPAAPAQKLTWFQWLPLFKRAIQGSAVAFDPSALDPRMPHHPTLQRLFDEGLKPVQAMARLLEEGGAP